MYKPNWIVEIQVQEIIFFLWQKTKVKIKIYIEMKTTLEIFLKQKVFYFDLKDFIFCKLLCKMYNL